jgi:hypothetical protein
VVAALVLATATPAVAAEGDRLPLFGAGFDIGVPDGVGVNAFFRPIQYLRLQAGPIYNVAGFGIRGGATVVPFDAVVTPTFTFEAGYYFPSDGTRISNLFSLSLDPSLQDVLRSITYTFGNLHLGLEIGSSRSVMFTLHFGYSYLVGRASNFTPLLQQQTGDSSLTAQDIYFRATGPSLKLGLIVFFG